LSSPASKRTRALAIKPWPARGRIINRSDKAQGFELLPGRWVVERTFAWLNRNRRPAKDVKETVERSTAWLFIAFVQLMARRPASL